MNILTKFLPLSLRPYSGRILLTAIGFVVAILCLTIGFWRTLLIVVLTCIGYAIGRWSDGALDLEKLPIPARWR